LPNTGSKKIQKGKGKMKKYYVALTTAAVAFSPVMAMAALSQDQSDAVTAITTNITDLLAAGWGVVLLGFGGLIAIKLFKKYIGKSV
jgi:hypothetical protein